MKKKLLIFTCFSAILLFVCGVSPSYASKITKTGIYDCFKVNSSSSQIGRVAVNVTSWSEDGWKGYLMLFDKNGKAIFRGKSGASDGSSMEGGMFGRIWPAAAADIDGDGYTEIIVSTMQSDIRPHRFEVLRWKDGKLSLIRKNGYLIGKTDSKFVWSEQPNDRAAWIMTIKQLPSGQLTGGAFKYIKYGSTGDSWDVLLTPNKNGFTATAK